MQHSQTRRTFLKTTASLTAASALLNQNFTQAADRPNILWITCEDMSPHLGCYGDLIAHTPNLDRFASEGIRYEHAYATAPLCTPARSSIITGIYASTLGTQHLRGFVPIPDQINCFTEYLREAGYYCSNNVKEDYNFVTPKNAWDESSDTAHWRKRPDGKPFFSVFNFMTTHQSRTRYDKEELEKVNKTLKPEERYDPEKIPLPPYYPDTPVVRTNMAAFYTQVTIMDKEFQQILDQLKEDGLDDDTIVFFYGDHGDGLPRSKRWLHDTGIRVPLLVRFPKKYQHLAPGKPGSVEKRLVNFADLAPTVLNLASVEIPETMQGLPFLGKNSEKEHEYVVAIRDRVDEVLEFSRTIVNHRYQYIRNFFPHRPRMQRSFFSELTPIRQEIRRLDAEGQLTGDEAWLMQPSKPAEELYDLQNDPYEMNNLADSSDHKKILQTMRRALFDWMREMRDLSLLPETMMLELAEGKPPYFLGQNKELYSLDRILRVADKVGRGSQYVPEFTEALDDSNAAARYWAAVGLAAVGGQAKSAEEELQNLLNDPFSTVRFAAAEALCNLDHEDEALQVLEEGILNKDVKVQLHATQVLVAIGEKARPAVPTMKKALKTVEGMQDHGWYMREAILFMLEQ